MTMHAVDASDSQMGLLPEEAAWRGIELCRRGEWQEGFYWLSLATNVTVETSSVPSLFFAYLGYGLARFHGEVDEGLRLCRRAVELELYQPESHYYLAATYLLAGDRRSAMDAIEQGLQVDATHPGLTELVADMGPRRSPVLAFLPRRHALNRWLGKARHRLFGPREAG
ncbi:MAG TPA: hypothetical protein VGG06_12370 [Thermoanaerobaculia bacterium]|jgi:hypothetical protein